MIKNVREFNSKPLEIDLTGPEGNAFVLIGYAKKLAKSAQIDSNKIIDEMTSGDYEHLLEVFENYFGDFVILYR